jgi:hypothetical protein
VAFVITGLASSFPEEMNLYTPLIDK